MAESNDQPATIGDSKPKMTVPTKLSKVCLGRGHGAPRLDSFLFGTTYGSPLPFIIGQQLSPVKWLEEMVQSVDQYDTSRSMDPFIS